MAVSLASGVDPSALLVVLADGRAHSGARLARELEASLGAVQQGILRLKSLGIDVKAQARRGYCLPQPVELLDALKIRAALGRDQKLKLNNLEVLFEADSTNTRLLTAAPPPSGQADVCIAELQHSGRGRQGRRWIAPFGGSIALSLGWSFRDAASANPALSLAVGVAICRALTRVGARGMSLKWPNDVWFNDRKVGGVLVELKTEVGGAAHVVIGVGLNVSLSAAARREIEETGVRAAAVVDACTEAGSRNRMTGTLLDELLRMLDSFEKGGFAPFRDAWTALDALRGRPARILAANGAISGTACGVDEDGALLLESGGRIQRFLSGEVSLALNLGDA
jgi:BirA family transcriptional regulator, biotin operon repressor / biotin---[acetyl-CoA-carboxylase] ligase